MPVSLTVNGQKHVVSVDGDTPLLWAIRDEAGLTGTKFGCGIAQCGACTVFVDGNPRRSCVTPVSSVDGAEITTIEGLSQARLHPVQQAFLDEQSVQCGFCTPGLVMAAAALLQSNAEPSEADIGAALTNLCRCGVYPRLVRAVQRAGAVMRGPGTAPPAPQFASPETPEPTPEPSTAPASDATIAPKP